MAQKCNEFMDDISVIVTMLSSFCAQALFSQDDTFSAKCAMVGVWFVGVVYYESMKYLIRGVFGGR